MYLKHWDLREPPFAPHADPRWLYQGEGQDEVLARMQFLIDHHHPLGILSGPAGCGKSLVLEAFAQHLEGQGTVVVRASLAGLDRHELWWKLAEGLKLNPSPQASAMVLWREIADHLEQCRYIGRDVVLLLDDADEAPAEALQGLVRLLAVHRTPEARLTILLGCRIERLSKLEPRLVEQAELRIELEPLTAEETGEYLKLRLSQAGCQDPVFSNAAITRLHELTAGNPRRINQLADLSLVAATAQHMQCVDTQTIDDVYFELESADSAKHVA